MPDSNLTPSLRVQETTLVERVRAGDPAAERALYDAHVDRVHRLAYRMTGDAEQARELTQRTFIRVFDRLGGFRAEARLSTWIHRIAVTVILNGLRSIRRREGRHVPLARAGMRSVPPVAGDPWIRERIRAAIDALPPRSRAVFVMHDLEGYTHEEIGTALGVAVGTSKAQLHRARRRLRETLGDLMETPTGG